LKRYKIFGLLFAFLFITQVTYGQTHEFLLDNGLKLLVKEDHRSPVVVSQVWYKVGGSYEHDGLTGISHALEHMMFKGTEKYPAGEFSRIISENGGTENAFTGKDYTAYFQTLEKSRLPISFELEADRMRNLQIPDEEFIKEIEVVKEERRLRTEDNPRSFTYEVAMATAFQTSPYRLPIVGWMADLDAMKSDDLKKWYQQWYAPNNATVVIAGDVSPQAVFELAKQYFGPLQPEKVSVSAVRPEVPQQGLKRIVVKRPAKISYLMMSYKVPALNALQNPKKDITNWEPYAIEVLAGILSGGGSARFSSRLVRDQEVAASVGASYDMSARLDGLFSISGTPARGKDVEDLENAIRLELRDLQKDLIDINELDRVKAQVVSSDVYEKDSVFYQAMILGILETVGLTWKVADEYVENIQAVTAEQVRDVAIKHFVDDHLTVTTLDPQPLDTTVVRQAGIVGGRHEN